MRPSASLLVCLGMGNRQSRPWIVSDELWSLVEPLLPKPGPKKAEGRPRVPARQALCGILTDTPGTKQDARRAFRSRGFGGASRVLRPGAGPRPAESVFLRRR
ncbi:transposase [Streptomyces sp. WAC08452]|nr:transposase [Streptomyces sp. WAC08452]RSS68635.1 transposase [Streptomyces sp. WAC06128]